MMFLSNRVAGFAACLLVSFVSAAEGNSVTLSQNPYSFDVAGEFSVDISADYVQNYATVATYNGEFDTFCVEADVVFYPSVTYTYVLASQDSMGRVLTEGAAYLYYEFATGQLQGYNYLNPAGRLLDAGELQAAIWAFQDNQSFPGYPALDTNPFYELATNTLGNYAFGPEYGKYDVDILQMWDGTVAAQNQLVYLGGIPDATSTIGLFVLACAGLLLMARRFHTPTPAPSRVSCGNQPVRPAETRSFVRQL